MRLRKPKRAAPLYGPQQVQLVSAVVIVVGVEGEDVTLRVGIEGTQGHEVTLREDESVTLRLSGYRFDG